MQHPRGVRPGRSPATAPIRCFRVGLGFRRSRSFSTDGPWDPEQTLLGKGATLREKIRPYREEDAPAVHQVHLRAFGGREAEARLVELLYAAGAAPVSLVATAEPDGRVVGHVLFSPVQLLDEPEPPTMVGLAPVAVLPEHQGRGIGSRLIRDGLEACRRAGYAAAVVLGEPGYYSRFGFERASARALGNEYGADEHFMVAELGDGALGGRHGPLSGGVPRGGRLRPHPRSGLRGYRASKYDNRVCRRVPAPRSPRGTDEHRPRVSAHHDKNNTGGPGRPAEAGRRGPLRATFRSLERVDGGPYSRQTPNSWRNRRRSCRRKILQNKAFWSALARTRTCDLLIRRPNRAVLCGSLRRVLAVSMALSELWRTCLFYIVPVTLPST